MERIIVLIQKKKIIIRLLLIIFLFLVRMNTVFVSAGETKQDEVLIKGTVTEGTTNEPLPGVAVLVKGTSIGTITDINGRYSIKVSPGESLQFSFVGYLDEEVTVRDQTTIDMVMIEDIIGLEEVVVTGYGVQKKSDLTGAIASVNGEDLTKIPASSFDDALEGRAAGVYASSETGAPGATAVIQIRGVSSINGGDPLIIIDGVPSSIYAINSINASDISSVEVLKDASSQAIYGASGGNGVILITTKQGELNKLTAELDYYFGYQVPRSNISLCNTEEFFKIYNELDVPERYRLDWPEDTIPYLPNTNWQKEITRDAPMQNINLAVSGGNDRSTFRFSAGYLTQKGVVPNSEYNRFNLRMKSEHRFFERVEIGENITFSRDYYDGFVNWYFNDFYASPVALALKMHPFVEPYIEGREPLEYSWGTSPITPGLENPFVEVDIINRQVPTYRLKGDMSIAIEIIKGLTFKSLANGGLDFGYSKEFNPIYHYSATVYNDVNSIDRTAWKNHSWYLQHTLTYNFSLAQHNISLMAGYEANYHMNEGFTASIDNLLSQDETMHYFNSATGSPSVQDYLTIEEVANDAYFGRINWDYKGKYLITSNIRRDRSSKFGPAYRSGVFPSFSLGWKFSEESFMQGLTWLSFGKIRAGWGKIGNSDIDPYQYYSRVITTDVYNASLDNETVSAGVASHGLPNLELHWEAMKSTNFGIDLTFFNNKLSLSADYFEKSNEGMLIRKPTPDLSGTFQINSYNEGGSTELFANIGQVYNKGYEITAGFKTRTGDFQHNINLNFSYVENEVGDIGDDTITSGNFLNIMSTFTAEGNPMGVFYGYKTDGLFQESDGVQLADGSWLITNQPFKIVGSDTVYAQPNAQPGDVRFVDVNGDTVINPLDRTIIGNPHPKYLFGFSYNLTYKIFDLSMFWQGSFGNDILQATKTWFYNNSGSYNWHTDVLDRWTPENTDSELFRLSYYDKNDNDRVSDFYIEPGGYLRLKNIQIGCTLPKNITTKLNITKLRVYVSLKDLITITKYKGLDPETAYNRLDPLAVGIDVSSYPRPVVYTFGINAIF